MSTSPPRSKSSKRRPARTGPDAATVELVWERDEGRCVSCGSPQVFSNHGKAFGWSIQHRQPRSRGGSNQPANLILLCGSGTTKCHGQVEAHPEWARAHGWSCGSGMRPAETPMTHVRLGVVLLTAQGYEPTTKGTP